MSDCRFGSGDRIYEQDLPRLLSEDCIIEPGASIVLFYNDEVKAEEFGSGVIVQPPRKETVMDELEGSGTQPIEPPHAPAPAAAAPSPAALPVAAGTEQAAPIDVNTLTQMTGGNGGIAVVLALIAVLFGAAGWKFWTRISDQHHELKMKQMETEAANAEKSHSQCAVTHAKLEARLAALEGKVSSVQEATSSFDTDIDFGDFKKRLTKIEKALKAKPKQS